MSRKDFKTVTLPIALISRVDAVVWLRRKAKGTDKISRSDVIDEAIDAITKNRRGRSVVHSTRPVAMLVPLKPKSKGTK